MSGYLATGAPPPASAVPKATEASTGLSALNSVAGMGAYNAQQASGAQSSTDTSGVLANLANMRAGATGSNPDLAAGLVGAGINAGGYAPGAIKTPVPHPGALNALGSMPGVAAGAANTSGGINSWIAQAMKDTGVGGSDWASGLALIAKYESGDNPNAINNWDSNAKAGHPSQGLMQTIPSTFSEYVPKSLASLGIDNPVANLAAAIEYINARYGGIDNVPGVRAVRSGGSYVGY